MLGVEILSYRESKGGQVRDPRWRERLRGKTLNDAFTLNQDIPNISGAIPFSRNLTGGVKRLLSIHAVALAHAGFLPRGGIDHLAAFPGSSADIAIIASNRIRIARRVIVDLGGGAKGHAIDQAVAALQAAGAADGLVNAGGGRPVLCDHRVSVIAPSYILADALTKIALAEPAKAQQLLKRYGGYLLLLPRR